MSNPVQRLEALLERVQHNRSAAPRASNPASVAKVQPRAEAPEARPAAPAPPAAATPPRAKPAPTPLEMALEGRVSQPTPPAAPARKPEPVPAPPAFISPPAGRPEPAPEPVRAAPAANPREGQVLADPGVPEPTKPIIQVVSKQPPATVLSFGELLKRSLSLRPR